MCGRGQSNYSIPDIQRLTGGRPVPRRLYGRGAAHYARRSSSSSLSSSSKPSSSSRTQPSEAYSSQVAISSTINFNSGMSAIPEPNNDDTCAIESHPIANLSPGMDVPVVFSIPCDDAHHNVHLNVHHDVHHDQPHHQHRYIDMMKWGLIPYRSSASSSPTASDYYKMFNARIETVHEKVSFKHLLPSRRCIVLYNGYYEWTGLPGNKTPYYVSLGNSQPMMMAALYDISSSGIESYTIMTCDACSSLQHLHPRQPIFLTQDHVDAWLDINANSIPILQSIAKQSYDGFEINIWEVDKRVTNAKYQGQDCSHPITSHHKPSSSSKQSILSYMKPSPDKVMKPSSTPSSPPSSSASSAAASIDDSMDISCPICDTNLSAMILSDREQHVHDCLLHPDPNHKDGQESSGDVIYQVDDDHDIHISSQVPKRQKLDH